MKKRGYESPLFFEFNGLKTVYLRRMPFAVMSSGQTVFISNAVYPINLSGGKIYG
jgi:hypothetical protein